MELLLELVGCPSLSAAATVIALHRGRRKLKIKWSSSRKKEKYFLMDNITLETEQSIEADACHAAGSRLKFQKNNFFESHIISCNLSHSKSSANVFTIGGGWCIFADRSRTDSVSRG